RRGHPGGGGRGARPAGRRGGRARAAPRRRARGALRAAATARPGPAPPRAGPPAASARTPRRLPRARGRKPHRPLARRALAAMLSFWARARTITWTLADRRRRACRARDARHAFGRRG